MRISNFILLCISFVTVLLISGCGNNDILVTPPDASTGPPTGISDQNSFTLASIVVAMEGIYNGVTSDVTARAADRHNNPVPDGTVIHFLTNGGAIPTQCETTDGACTVTWVSQNPKPGIARLIAYTDGEESFIDLNDNDAFDAGEPFTDTSEPFIDANGNGVFDAGVEEFVDRNSNQTFDAADGLYTGNSCVGDNTVCDRRTLFTWGATSIVMSSSTALVSFSPASVTIATGASTPLSIIVTDTNGNQMAEGTVVDITASDGSVDTASFTIGVGTFYSNIIYTAPAAAGSDLLTVKVTSPLSKIETVVNLAITVF